MSTVIIGVFCRMCRTLLYLIAGERCFSWLGKDGKKYLAAGIVYLAGLIVYFQQAPFGLLFFPAEFCALMIVSEGELITRFWKNAIVCSEVELVLGVLDSCSDLLFHHTWDVRINTVLDCFLAGILLWIVTGKKSCRQTMGHLEEMSLLQKVAVVLLPMTGSAIASYGQAIRRVLENQALAIYFQMGTIFLLCGILEIIHMFLKEGYQKSLYRELSEVKERILQVQGQNYQLMIKQEEELKRFRHDTNHQLGVLQVLLNKGNYEKAKRHLENIRGNFESIPLHRVQVGNEILDAVINLAVCQAEQSGIDIVLTGALQEAGGYDSYDMCCIFANSIANAIEATAKAAGEKRIEIDLVQHNSSIYYKIVNPACKEDYELLERGSSGKQDVHRHGYGVQNIRRAVERLKGKMTYSYREGKVMLEIFL